MNLFQCGRYTFNWQEKSVLVMGILNITPDSFYASSRTQSVEDAYKKANQMIEAGVDIIDVGAQSTRPGYTSISVEEERRRLLPVLEKLIALPVALSVDTDKSLIMQEALSIGVDLINDVSGFNNNKAIDAVKDSTCGLCVMHGETQLEKSLTIVNDMTSFFKNRIEELKNAHINLNRIIVDPGFGFYKTDQQSFTLLKELKTLENALGTGVLVGLSRKSLIGRITGQDVENRLAGSIAAALYAIQNGAKIIRVHDVKETIDAIKVYQAFSGIKS